jgi:hypothetical protein
MPRSAASARAPRPPRTPSAAVPARAPRPPTVDSARRVLGGVALYCGLASMIATLTPPAYHLSQATLLSMLVGGGLMLVTGSGMVILRRGR